jgi:hypothetical protein
MWRGWNLGRQHPGFGLLLGDKVLFSSSWCLESRHQLAYDFAPACLTYTENIRVSALSNQHKNKKHYCTVGLCRSYLSDSGKFLAAAE